MSVNTGASDLVGNRQRERMCKVYHLEGDRGLTEIKCSSEEGMAEQMQFL